MGASCEVSGRLLSFKLLQSTTILVFNEDFWWLASSEFNICVVHIMLFKGHFSSCLIVKCVVVLKALIKFLGQKKPNKILVWEDSEYTWVSASFKKPENPFYNGYRNLTLFQCIFLFLLQKEHVILRWYRTETIEFCKMAAVIYGFCFNNLNIALMLYNCDLFWANDCFFCARGYPNTV